VCDQLGHHGRIGATDEQRSGLVGEASLLRLGVDVIDLYYLHRTSPTLYDARHAQVVILCANGSGVRRHEQVGDRLEDVGFAHVVLPEQHGERSRVEAVRYDRSIALKKGVCGSWADRKRLVAVCSGERAVCLDRVVLGQ
jgi:hypothetical protein